MDEILNKAREVGKLVSRHAYFVALRNAEEAVRKDPDARALVEAFEQQQDKVARLLAERKPVEPGDKRRIADLQQRIMAHPMLKRLYSAQVDFKHLMDKLNGAIQDGLEGEEPKESA